MVICPVALAVGCKKCPIFKACPVKGIIGDYKAPAAPVKRSSAKANSSSTNSSPAKSSSAKSRSAKSRARRK